MPGLYARWINQWETKLATRDTNRVVRPFEWGLDWMEGVHRNGDPRRAALDYMRSAVADSDAFYAYRTPTDYKLDGTHLTFTSPLVSQHPENNTVHGEFFAGDGRKDRAVVVLPQWNSDAGGHMGLCKLLNKFGVPALRMSMAYHDHRMPPELERADYHVSSNIGRTVHASRQSVIDVRASLDWLERQGYQRLGVLGTSLGSCVAFIAAAHDARIRVGVFNHVSMYFSDVVWTGVSTRHVRSGLDGSVTREELRALWSVISPASFMDRMAHRDLQSLLIWAPYDTTFLPEFSKQVLAAFRERNLPHSVLRLPCAHYTTGRFPFNWIDGLTMCRFLAKRL